MEEIAMETAEADLVSEKIQSEMATQ